MTDETKINVDQVRGIAGLENFEDESPQIPFVKILNGSAATDADMAAGTIVGKNNEVLAEKGQPFVFIPIYIFTRYSIWEQTTRSLIKFSFSKSGKWSDGTPILHEEVNWIGHNPPLATESFDIVILPVSELNKAEEEREFYFLSIPIRNKQKAKFVKDLKTLFAKSSVEQKVTELFSLAYSFTPEKVKDDKGNVWFEYANPKFEKKIQDSTKQLCQTIYKETKDINKMSTALTPTVMPAEDAATSAEVVNNPEF